MDNLECVLSDFFDSALIPDVMQNFGLALLTAFIPMVFFLLSPSVNSLFEWDKMVILDKVIKAKTLLPAIMSIFLPLLFWDYESLISKLILFLIWIIGITFLVVKLVKSYRWIKTIEIEETDNSNNFRSKFRNKYLDKITNPTEMENTWTLTWREKISNAQIETNLTQRFVSNMDGLIEGISLETFAQCLRMYYKFIENRALYNWFVFRNTFKKLLEWDYVLYQLISKQQTNNEDHDQYPYQCADIIRRVIERFVLSGLQNRTAFIMFPDLIAHVKGKDKNYVREFLSQAVCRTLFDNIAESNESHDIWVYNFPPDWKLTTETLADENNVASKIWRDNFLQWASSRISGSKGQTDYDKSLNEIARNLFPSTDPILWAELLTFVMGPWTDGNRMKSLVEEGPSFGFSGRVMPLKFEDTENWAKELHEWTKLQEDATLKFALSFFGRAFTEEILNGYISDLGKLDYDDAPREARRLYFISIFRKMISLIDPKKN